MGPWAPGGQDLGLYQVTVTQPHLRARDPTGALRIPTPMGMGQWWPFSQGVGECLGPLQALLTATLDLLYSPHQGCRDEVGEGAMLRVEAGESWH